MPHKVVGDIHIEYELDGKEGDPVIVLIMGLGGQLVDWQEEMVAKMVNRGFQVLRFDNRDQGLSTKLDGQAVADPLTLMGLAAEEKFAEMQQKVPYLLSDMAADLRGLLDALGIQVAHVAGASMGGMIAQEFAIAYPERTLSLVSIMSTSGDPSLPSAEEEAMNALLSPAPADPSRDEAIARQVAVFDVIGSPGFRDDAVVSRAYHGSTIDRSYYPEGFGRQLGAILASGSRTESLKALNCPTLVIHGRQDPLVPLACGEHVAAVVPGAKLDIVEGMGHDFTRKLAPVYAQKIVDFIQSLSS